ncbi:hypothetical protein LPW26_12790 [Rhodopseudomonas sp. HC1]|uniref:hypothetical protein n=1 Tax=Rhodopseudomonas infernalis TaxID=2897386 RepID=UPI001EE80619|nr:hypothetical protein [Rhodopseudomonas infernalis]MCG6205520.1 hypothetical protein [Rhodopseudomonas infernalis]
MLKLLIQIARASGDFDEGNYLRSNPDVAKAVEIGGVESAHHHYIGFGHILGLAILRAAKVAGQS